MRTSNAAKFSPMLIDTHILIWLLEAKTDNFGAATRSYFKTQPVTVSAASLIELAVKKRKGKLDMPGTTAIVAALDAKNIEIIDIKAQHISNMPGLDITPHADPFDLLLVAQAISESLPLLTCDSEILQIIQPGLQLFDSRN